MLAIMAIVAFTLDGVLYFGLALYLVILTGLARLPRNGILPILKTFLLLFAITFILHILFAPPGGKIYFSIAGVKVSSLGVQNGLLYSFRIFLFLMVAALVNLTTSPADMTDGMFRLIKPLRLIRVPVSEISMMLFIALRFIPILADEVNTIRAAQLSRGLKPGKGPVGRIKSIIPLLMPLFLVAIRRADHLALAIESRGYKKGIMRTSLRDFRLGRIDLTFMIVSITILVVLIIISGMIGK